MKFVRDTQFNVQAVAKGTIAGTITLQFSNDSGFPQRPDPSNGSTVATVAVAGAGVISIIKPNYLTRIIK